MSPSNQAGVLGERGPLERGFDALVAGLRMRSGARTVTEEDIAAFSALTGDRHPLHRDAERAAAGPFGGLVAPGPLLLSLALGLLDLDPDAAIALRELGPATFKAPVRIGDTIHVDATVRELRPLGPERGLVRLACQIGNQEGRAVARFSLGLLWRRGAGPGTEAPRP